MNAAQATAAYNAVTSALIGLGVTPRDALYAAEAAMQCLHKWEARFDDLRDLAHEADMRELQREQLRGDVDVHEANACARYWDAVDLAEDDDDLEDQRRMLDQEQPDD